MYCPAAGTRRTASRTQESIGRPDTSWRSLMRRDLILFPRPAARIRVWRVRRLPGTGFLGLDQVDELVLVADPVEVRVVLGVDPVLLVQTDRLVERGDRPDLVSGLSVRRGDRVVDHVAM